MKIIVWAGTWLAGVVMMALVIGVALGVASAAGLVQEDSVVFNCHIMGNFECGQDAAWHGFVNIF